MLLALGAVSSALDALQSLTSSKSSRKSTGFSQTATNPFDFSGSAKASGSPAPASGSNGFSQLSPATMSALLAAQSQSSTGSTTSASNSPSNALKDLFSQLDTNGDSQVSKSEFENALGAGGTNIAQADNVFSKMDNNGDGSVNLGEMSSALKGGRGHHVASSEESQSSTGSTTSASTRPSDALKDLFSQLDTNRDSQISQSEFENALGAGGTNIAQADNVFGKMDSNGDGSVNLDEMSSALKGGKGRHDHHHVASSEGSGSATGTDGSSSDPLLQALQGASSTSVTNSDGSTTTSMTYADGSKVTMTSAAAKTASSSATSSYNIIEQMIQRQAQAIAFSATASLSVSA